MKIDPKANQADVYTKGGVDAKINKLANNAPEALNTLKELAQALGDDENYPSTVINLIATNPPLNSPPFTETVSVNGTLACPQVAPYPSQNNFNEIKAPRFYHYDGGLSNAPTSSPNFRSIEMGREDR